MNLPGTVTIYHLGSPLWLTPEIAARFEIAHGDQVDCPHTYRQLVEAVADHRRRVWREKGIIA